MADLLATVAVTYALVTIAGWAVDWLEPKWAVICVGGSLIPDLQKVDLLVDADSISRALGIPFTYSHLGTLGGVLLVAGVITVLFDRERWRRVYGLLVSGGLVHLLLDGMRVYADGQANTWLYPLLPSYRPPTPNLFVTSDPTVTVVALGVALLVFGTDRYLRGASDPTTSVLRR
jgi:hypothetical protein